MCAMSIYAPRVGFVLTVTNSLTLISAAGHSSLVFFLGMKENIVPLFES
jgi:hypothetical protein